MEEIVTGKAPPPLPDDFVASEWCPLVVAGAWRSAAKIHECDTQGALLGFRRAAHDLRCRGAAPTSPRPGTSRTRSSLGLVPDGLRERRAMDRRASLLRRRVIIGGHGFSKACLGDRRDRRALHGVRGGVGLLREEQDAQADELRDPQKADSALEAYLEVLMVSSGESKEAGRYTLCGLAWARSWATRSPAFPRSTLALKGWGHMEPAASREPTPYDIALSIAREEVEPAAAILRFFVAYLRPSECLIPRGPAPHWQRATGQ